jgi:hypothetical protein
LEDRFDEPRLLDVIRFASSTRLDGWSRTQTLGWVDGLSANELPSLCLEGSKGSPLVGGHVPKKQQDWNKDCKSKGSLGSRRELPSLCCNFSLPLGRRCCIAWSFMPCTADECVFVHILHVSGVHENVQHGCSPPSRISPRVADELRCRNLQHHTNKTTPYGSSSAQQNKSKED